MTEPTKAFLQKNALTKRYFAINYHRPIEYWLHVAADGTEHRLKCELAGASIRVKRTENYEQTFTKNLYRVSDNQEFPVRPRGLGWSRINDGYDYEGSALWQRFAP